MSSVQRCSVVHFEATILFFHIMQQCKSKATTLVIVVCSAKFICIRHNCILFSCHVTVEKVTALMTAITKFTCLCRSSVQHHSVLDFK